jgi:hypothetical protein
MTQVSSSQKVKMLAVGSFAALPGGGDQLPTAHRSAVGRIDSRQTTIAVDDGGHFQTIVQQRVIGFQ